MSISPIHLMALRLSFFGCLCYIASITICRIFMPQLELGLAYDQYVQRLIDSGLYNSYAEVVQDALRHHMGGVAENKGIAAIYAAIKEGEDDMASGRFTDYTPALVDTITEKVLGRE
jgi:putative addiction module CopG family antidote